MNHLEIRPSRWHYILLLAMSLGFVAAGVFILARDGPRLVGWTTILFFGSCGLAIVSQLRDTGPRLIISDQGVFDRTLGVGMIPWAEIQGAFVKSISGNDFVCLVMDDTEKYLGRLSPIRRSMSSANEALGFTPLSLNLSGLRVNTEEVFELVMKKCEEAHVNGEPDGRANRDSADASSR